MLSICIPTWNRAHTLPRLFASIAPQWRPGLEVLVADNASTDNTPALVRDFQRSLPKGAVRYVRAKQNGYFDRNILRCVESAKHDMCWIIGSDDTAAVGAVARVMDTIQNAPGCLIVGDVQNRAMVDGSLKPLVSSTAWPDYSFFWFDEPGAMAHYLSGAQTIHACLPFISSVVFPRKAWPAGPMPMNWQHLNYSHLYGWWRMVLNGTPIVTRRKQLVEASSGFPDRRDSETMNAAHQSVMVIQQLLRMFPDQRDKAAIRKVWRYEYPKWRVKSLDERCKHEPAWPFVLAGLQRALGFK